MSVRSRSVDDAISSAIRTVGVALVLATLTTMVGFLTNLVNPLPALREFGVLAAIGIFASFLLMLTFVPAVREILDRRGVRVGTFEPDRLVGGDQRALGQLIGRTSTIATKWAPLSRPSVALLLGGVGFWGYTNISTKFSFIDFIPTTSPLRTTFETLLADFGGGFGENTQVSIEGDVATADAWNAMVAANGGLVDTANVVTYSPVIPAGSVTGGSDWTVDPTRVTVVCPVGERRSRQAAGVDESFMLPAGADVASDLRRRIRGRSRRG